MWGQTNAYIIISFDHSLRTGQWRCSFVDDHIRCNDQVGVDVIPYLLEVRISHQRNPRYHGAYHNSPRSHNAITNLLLIFRDWWSPTITMKSQSLTSPKILEVVILIPFANVRINLRRGFFAKHYSQPIASKGSVITQAPGKALAFGLVAIISSSSERG